MTIFLITFAYNPLKLHYIFTGELYMRGGGSRTGYNQCYPMGDNMT